MAETEKKDHEETTDGTGLPDSAPDTAVPPAGEKTGASPAVAKGAGDDNDASSADELDDEFDDALRENGEAAMAEKAIAVDAWDEDAAFSGDELDDTTFDAGDREPGADIAVDTLESLISFQDEASDGAPENNADTDKTAPDPEGEGLDAAGPSEAPAETPDPAEPDNRAESEDFEKAAPAPKKKKLLLPVVAGLSVVVLGGIGTWVYCRQDQNVVPAKISSPAAAEQVLSLEGFLIPYNREGRHYLSFGISLQPSTPSILQAIRLNQEAVRGHIFDRMKDHIDRQSNTPTPAMVKRIVEEGLDAYLSIGRAGRVEITAFAFI